MISGLGETIVSLPQLVMACAEDGSYEHVAAALRNDDHLDENDIEEIYTATRALPLIRLESVEVVESSGGRDAAGSRVHVPTTGNVIRTRFQS
jgi:hypothetical protein